jgi:hypothetical protein
VITFTLELRGIVMTVASGRPDVVYTVLTIRRAWLKASPYTLALQIVENEAPCHIVKVTHTYLQEYNMHQMKWPVNSLDLNGVENFMV